MIRDLAPLVGRRLTIGVVPDWHGAWPLAAHPDYCGLVQGASDELLLHGYRHRRLRGSGPTSWLTGGCDEMNGLNRDETRRTIERGQHLLADAFGRPARGFLPPGWQRGHVGRGLAGSMGVDHVLGFFSLDASAGASVPLATWSWDCGRWGWLGNIGHGVGRVLRLTGDRVPSLAIHPRDPERGFWPSILQLTQELLEAGYEPSTPSALLEASC